MDLVVCVDNNWGIGLDGSQSVVVKEDRKHFKELTEGGTVIVGRKTLEDFPGGKPLKNRKNIVLTRNSEFFAVGALIAHSIDEAMLLCRDDERVFVIGGESVYEQLVDYCERAYITYTYVDSDADAFFPNLDEREGWELIECGDELKSVSGTLYRYVTYKNSLVRRYEGGEA